MTKARIVPISYFLMISLGILILFPECSHAQSAFQAKLGGLRDALTGTLLPLVSTIGLVYAAMLYVSVQGKQREK